MVLWWTLTLPVMLISLVVVWIIVRCRSRRSSDGSGTGRTRSSDGSGTVRTSSGTVRTSLVLGSGGHTTEMLKMVASLDVAVYTPRTYYVAETDKLSCVKVELQEGGRTDYALVKIPRAREVHQSLVSSVFSTLRAFLRCVTLLAEAEPQLLLANGPGTCVPVVVAAWLFAKLRLNRPVTAVFVESVCRVNTLSLSGKILRHIVDKVLVQWKELADTQQRTEYIGKFL